MDCEIYYKYIYIVRLCLCIYTGQHVVSHYESTPDASDTPICAVVVVIAWVFVLGPDVSDYSPNSDQIEPREGVAWRGRSACCRITASLVAIQSILRQSKQKKVE